MTLRQTYYPIADTTNIFDAAIVYSKMLFVAREGVVYDVLTSVNDVLLNTRQVHYNPSTGVLQFNADIPFNSGESINIVYDPNI
jgi:hypothetical protein